MKEVASRTMDGITDLVVFAPIREGFINAFETITYASRLELVANALNRLRIAAREYERITPFTDVTERILSLLDFRVGVIDEDLFGLEKSKKKYLLKPKRYLYLTATFEGGFEPYMRQIWQPLGPFLDLLFCNCEGYITATDHSFDEYVQWVRDNQMDSAIFYNTTGITVRDQKYLAGFERAQRAEMLNGVDPTDLWERDGILASHVMAYPDDESAKARGKHPRKATELGFEALNVLYKLADYYPPEWLTKKVADVEVEDGEGRFLIRATRELVRGWDRLLDAVKDAAAKGDAHAKLVLQTFKEPVNWYDTGTKYLATRPTQKPEPDPAFDHQQVQSGILKAHGSRETPIRYGALMLFTVRDARAARKTIRKWVHGGLIWFGDAKTFQVGESVFANIAFTSLGLLELGMDYPEHDCLPKEFREGLAQRTSQVGDMRENHPRNWILPERNGPAFLKKNTSTLPPVDLDEVDFVIQLRGYSEGSVKALAKQLGSEAAPGATLESIEWLHVGDLGGLFRDHFGFLDGLSQPRPKIPATKPLTAPVRDQVALGEVLAGYGNDRGDGAPALFDELDRRGKPPETDTHWRNIPRQKAFDLLKNGSFTVIRKIGEEVAALDAWLDREKRAVADQLDIPQEEARARLKAAILGRDQNGDPLVPAASADKNDFDYQDDGGGIACPHAAHIRRANPRRWDPRDDAPTTTRREFGRPTPRLVRRGMLFGRAADKPRGLMFIAYAASIAEQYEVIQRWLNGGNPTDVASANNDPLTGVRPKDGPNSFRFTSRRSDKKKVVVRVELPPVVGDGAQPGRHPFTPLYWGLYLFTPSRAGLEKIVGWEGTYRPLREMLEYAVGQVWIDRLMTLPEEQAAKEWKRLIEDFVAKDPSERAISPHVFAAIRYTYGGALDLSSPLPPPQLDRNSPLPPSQQESKAASSATDYDWDNPNIRTQNIILCAGRSNVGEVLADWPKFSSEEQLRRIIGNAGPIYVTQQPDDDYNGSNIKYSRLNYHEESCKTNKLLFSYGEDRAFLDGYRAGKKILDHAKASVGAGVTSFKAELRRQYFQPAIAELWATWYGLPDGKAFSMGGWSWQKLVAVITDPDTERTAALCPGDFMAPSRGAVFPRPNQAIEHYAKEHGAAIRKAGLAFVDALHQDPTRPRTELIAQLFKDYPPATHREVLARNIVGTMIGAIPPMDANLRNITLEWLLERRLWRHQAMFKAALNGGDVEGNAGAAAKALAGPISQAMCKRPAPDLLFRTAKTKTEVKRDKVLGKDFMAATTKEGDMVIVSLASASQRSLHDHPNGDVSVIFGGKRDKAQQGYVYKEGQVTPANDGLNPHACPAQKMAMGGMAGILAALLDAGTIQALPASLIVRISDWKTP